jgi:hypothetical protein
VFFEKTMTANAQTETRKPGPGETGGCRVIVRTIALKKIYRMGDSDTHALAGIDMVIFSGG